MQTAANGYLRLLRRWLPLLLLGPVFGGVAGYLVVRTVPSVYQATVTLLVQPADAAGTGVGAVELQAAQDLAQTYAESIHTRRILSEAAAQLGLGALSERDLEARVQARRVAGTELLRITADDTNPSRAADLANSVAQVFVKQNADFQANRYASSRDNLAQLVAQMQADIDARQTIINSLQAQAATPERDGQLAQLVTSLAQVRTTYGDTVKSYEDLRIAEARSTNTATIFDAAVPPDDPVRPNRSLTVLLAALAGLLAAVGIAVVAEYLDDGLQNARRIASVTGLPTLGVVPSSGSSGGPMRGPTGRPAIESYRVLRSRLAFAMQNEAARSLLIASATPGEGKSTVAANLALVFAEGGQRVILVDADIHRPSQMRLFELPNERGLSTLLLDEGRSAQSLLAPTWNPNLQVLTAGPEAAQPAALFSSGRLQEVFDELADLCDLVVVDTPPLLAQPDGVLMSPYADAVLFVVDARRTRGRKAARALEMLRSSGARLIGVAVNRVSKDTAEYLPYENSRATPFIPDRPSGVVKQQARAEAGHAGGPSA